LLVGHAGSVAGRQRLAGLEPATQIEAVRRAQARTCEAVRLLAALGRQPYDELPDIAEALTAARLEGLHLEPRALLDAASFLEGGQEISRCVARADVAPELSGWAGQVADFSPIAAGIRRAILGSAELADDASPRLAEIRRALARQRLRLTSLMESYLHGKEADRLLQERLITTRNDRYVLLLKAEQRGALPGVVHGSSGSGASLFVEPLAAVELNNEIVALGDEERREIVRILRELTAHLRAAGAAIAEMARVLAELDVLQAMALLASEMQAVSPEISEDLELRLLDARHPLLLPASCERLGLPRRAAAPVPVTLEVGFGRPVLVISGPNTGGKTVALKTVGLLALMAQSGLHIPVAGGSVLPTFRRIYADIGDEQSISADLSTFSSHLATIVEMTRDLTPPALVLLDEVGAGTDPIEGGALGVAIVEHFRSHAALVVTTTHHGQLKAYAQATPGVVCASFGYDPESYAPTYRLALGVAGRSLAFEMAERFGLPPAVVADARGRRDTTQAQAEALLARLEAELAEAQRARAALAGERAELADARASIEGERAQLDVAKRSELEAFRRELARRGDRLARQAADAIQATIDRLHQAPRVSAAAGDRARRQALHELHEAHAEALAGFEPTPRIAAPVVTVGDRVRVVELGVVGDVLALPDEQQAEVAVAGKRLRVPRNALEPVAQASRAASRPGGWDTAKPAGSAPPEINVLGLTVDEALPRVDKWLDDAALQERREVRVIHGFGQGRLRTAVAGLLEGHPHVATYRTAAANEGGGGVTIVELKD